MKPKLFIALKALVEYKGRVLIIRESTKNPVGTNPNKYDVVGGRLKSGESYSTCLKREVSEETGLKIKIGRPFYIGEWRPLVKGRRWQIIGVFFSCQAKSNKVRLSRDHDNFRWINPKNYKKELMIKNLLPVFKSWLNK